MSGWQAVHVGTEGDDVRINGVAVWMLKWRCTVEGVLLLSHPSHPHQHHDFRIYEVDSLDVPTRFAAAEVSNGVWAFYVPT